MTITSAANNADTDVKSLSSVQMYKWEDEKWSTVRLSAGYAVNDRVKAQPYIIVPADAGHFSIYIEAEGFYAVKSVGGKAPDSWCGFVAYNSSDPGWLVNQYSGCTISNYQVTTTFVAGHPDATVNDCHLKPGRAVEADFFASFDLKVDEGGGYWILYVPYYQKSSDYNYIVSYGNYTNKTCEFGSLAISIDEKYPGSTTKVKRNPAPSVLNSSQESRPGKVAPD